MRDKKWERFERLIEAIHKAENKGANVTWDDEIDGRQFDVTVRFTDGLYWYLTVVECRDESRRIKVNAVEAFVTKAQGVLANKAVMVSSSGFQRGCFKVAKRHGMSLFTLQQLEEIPEEVLTGELTQALNIYGIVLERSDGLRRALEDDHRPENYLAKQVVVRNGEKRSSLEEAISWRLHTEAKPITEKERSLTHSFPSASFADFPYEDDAVPLAAVHFKVRMIQAHIAKGPMFEPSLFARAYEYADAITGEKKSYTPGELDVDYGTAFRPGTFYKQPEIGFAFYCDAIKGNLAMIYLVESYQLGTLIQAQFEQKVEYGRLYVEVTDSKEVARLQKMLDRMKRDD